MASERSRFQVGVQAQETQVYVIPQEASINVNSNGHIVTRVLSRVVRVTEVRRIVGVQRLQTIENPGNGCALFCKAMVTVFCLLLALAVLAAALSMIIIGSLYFNECPAENKIPIYLVVAGVVLLLVFLISCFKPKYLESLSAYVVVLCLFFLMGWSIAGIVWVINVQHMDFNEPLSPHYCNRMVYKATTYSAGIGASIAILMCCAGCSSD
ncbi:transmembrane protein 272-like [Ornithodoros turicata]|uniref:transmembrane protein 272-like n=1 Tax=Ornithodoros turicata TaxID=34597 RepID=UPI00313A4C66